MELPQRALQILASLFRRRRCDASVRLRNAGASRELVRHVDEEGEILQAWDTCPRGTWAVELVTRGGVERSVTAHALIGLGSEYRDESLSALAGSYVQNEVDVEALLTSVESRLRSLIDTMDDVVEIAKAATVAQERGERDEVQRLGVLHDEAYARHHAEMARVIRRRISRDVVRATFGVAGTGPYR